MTRGAPYTTAPEELHEFVRRFNRGDCFGAHQVLERAWLDNRSAFYKGLIIFASAFVHAQRGNRAGVVKQLGKVPGYLEPYAPCHLGLDVRRLLEQARSWRRRARTAQLSGHPLVAEPS